MSASGKSAGKGGGQNRSAGGLKTGGAVQPLGGGFYQQPMQMYQTSNTSSIYNPGNRLFDRMTPGFQSDYRPGLDFYGPSQFNGRLLVNQPMPGYYQQFMAPGSNYAPPPEPVNPDPTPAPTQPQGPVYEMPQFIDTPFGRIDLRFLSQNMSATNNASQAAASPPAVSQTTNQNTGGYDGSGINPNGAAASNTSSAPILDQAAGNTASATSGTATLGLDGIMYPTREAAIEANRNFQGAPLPTAPSPYEQRIQELMSRGKTREQAIAQNSSAINQGADYDLSGFVTDDEWRRFSGQS
tara:strand:+ start:216 stop:1106 length:891 start_codon:yes stop_codon:yes gene_type:complete